MRHFYMFVCLLVILCSSVYAATPTEWRMLNKGLDYTILHPDSEDQRATIHAFRIDLKYFRLHSILAQNFKRDHAYAAEFLQLAHGLIAINGGFFSPEFKPLGLRIEDGKVLNPLTKTSWWGIFLIQNDHASIVTKNAHLNPSRISFAVQAGPRLLVNSQIPSLKDDEAERTALGITRDGKVIIAVTNNAPMTTSTLASLLRHPERDGGLNCRDALNLDGGTSTQLYAALDNHTLSIPSYRSVADAVVVSTK